MKYSKGLRVVIVNGRPGTGKTTFEHICKDILGNAYVSCRSTVDKVKEIAAIAGWNGEKTPAARKMLSDLKDIFTNYNDMPFNDIVAYAQKFDSEFFYYGVEEHPHILFVDDREPEHIERLKQALNAITLIIRRPGDREIETSNHADENVFNYKYDYVVLNDGTIQDLDNKALNFLNWLFDKN